MKFDETKRKTLGEWLEFHNIAAVCRWLGISRQALHSWTIGTNKPRPVMLFRLATLLRVQADQIIFPEETEEQTHEDAMRCGRCGQTKLPKNRDDASFAR